MVPALNHQIIWTIKNLGEKVPKSKDKDDAVIYASNFYQLKEKKQQIEKEAKASKVILSALVAALNRFETNIAIETCNENDW